MKKILFGSASAILAVIGFSAFKTAKTSTITYYWFSFTEEGAPIGDPVVLNNSDATFILRATTLSIASSPCNETAVSQCVVGFTASQIFTTSAHGHKVLKTKGVDPGVSVNSQTSITSPATSAYVKSN